MANSQPVVLVLEDDAGIRSLIQALLRRMGVPTDTASNGAEALELLSSKTYAALVVDIMTPVVSGAEFLREVEINRPELLERTVVMTALNEVQIPHLVGPVPRVAILRKPFEINAFLDRMREALSLKAAASLETTESFCEKNKDTKQAV